MNTIDQSLQLPLAAVGSASAPGTRTRIAAGAAPAPAGPVKTSAGGATGGRAVQDGAEPEGTAVAAAVNQLNELMQDIRRELHFSVDEASGRTVIKVVDVETQEVIRQIPPEEVVSLAQNLEFMGAGLLGDVNA